MTHQVNAAGVGEGAHVAVDGRSCAMWRKSSYSNPNGACVQLRVAADVVEVRDSKDPGGPTLRFSSDAVAAFITAVVSEEF
ncbi:DUF397 domain-containing protein [Streptomyces zagrosensis]|uniref:DUF397 domain-containing protein n=1 Tax=Streptomyces zagrosensis TaxID=1042984 RepID=A0A7W9QAW7_9ACTN|nr:DUF397 domain-containing protein [Streptomyces zagrosensis]MBB5936403.1 hypothetical protein [Streptomyces zagrosensis]